jgi:uncharacterized protein DUF4124
MAHALAFLALAALASLPAGAGVLYKSVDAKGTVMFSDMPPPPEARVLETRVIGGNGGASPQGTAAAMAQAAQLIDSDEALARANAKVDMAEHALAEARKELLSPREGLRLTATRMTPADDARVQFFKRDVLAARQALMDLLRERRLALAAAQRQ